MKQIAANLSTIIFLFAMISCSKEQSSATGGTDITGTYKFISLRVITTATDQSGSGSSIHKAVTTSDYTSQNNSGTVTIDATRFVSTNISYTINTTAYSTLYENGVVTDTFSIPFQLTIPPSSGAGAYKRIGADSLYFPSSAVVIGGAAGTAQPGGAKLKYENGKLTLSGTTFTSSTTTNQGETVTTVGSGITFMTLQKQ